MMNGNTKFVVEGQSNHPCYRMYKHDRPYIDGVNVWIRWLWDRKYKLVLERQFGTDSTTRKRMRTKKLSIDIYWCNVCVIPLNETVVLL